MRLLRNRLDIELLSNYSVLLDEVLSESEFEVVSEVSELLHPAIATVPADPTEAMNLRLSIYY